MSPRSSKVAKISVLAFFYRRVVSDGRRFFLYLHEYHYFLLHLPFFWVRLGLTVFTLREAFSVIRVAGTLADFLVTFCDFLFNVCAMFPEFVLNGAVRKRQKMTC